MLRKALVLLPNTAPFSQLGLPFYATVSITPSDGVEAKVEQFLTGTMITPSVDTLHSSSISLKLQLDTSSSAKRELLFGFYLHIGYLVGILLCHWSSRWRERGCWWLHRQVQARVNTSLPKVVCGKQYIQTLFFNKRKQILCRGLLDMQWFIGRWHPTCLANPTPILFVILSRSPVPISWRTEPRTGFCTIPVPAISRHLISADIRKRRRTLSANKWQ